MNIKGDTNEKQLKEKGKKIIEGIIKDTKGVDPSMMARGNYGRIILQRDVSERIAAAMPTEVSKNLYSYHPT